MERAFYEFGINTFYWSSPRSRKMGAGLINLAASHRDEIVIILQSYDRFGWTIDRSVRKGLKALETEYADIVLLGWHNRHPPKRLVHEAFELKEKGMVRHVGMSGHKRRLFGEITRQKDSPIDVFMVRYNAAHRGAEEEIFPFLPDEGRQGIMTYTATRWGKLLNPRKMPPGERPMTAAECYRFALTNLDVDLCMAAPRNEEEMITGLTAVREGPLSEDEMARAIRIGNHVHG